MVGGTHRAPIHPSSSQQRARPPETNDAPPSIRFHICEKIIGFNALKLGSSHHKIARWRAQDDVVLDPYFPGSGSSRTLPSREYRHSARLGILTTPLPGPGPLSSRARRRDRVWPPPDRRDLQRISLPRIDPATRCSPTWPLEYVRVAAAVCYLQRDVFIKRSGLDRIPAIVARRQLYKGSSRCITIAGLSGFFTLSQSRDGPDR
jgi:hypothetical protein